MKPAIAIREQVRRNLVALISLVVAVTSLGYNTWRNEASEHNRNQRLVAIEVLRNLGELQQALYQRHWGTDDEAKDSKLTGWAIVLTIHDLAMVLESPVPESATQLRVTWARLSDNLGSGNEEDATPIVDAIDQVRKDLHALLRNLD